MLKKILIGFSLVIGSFQLVRAQSDERKFEAGGQVTTFRMLVRRLSFPNAREVTSDYDAPVYGFGGRFGFNASRHVAFEAEINFFPNDSDLYAGRKVESLFGIKAGKRFKKFGVFGKARPGFIRLQKGDYAPGGVSHGPFGGSVCSAQDPSPLDGCVHPVARTRFAFDAGGVVEIYPSKRTLIRVDVGDTII